MEATPGSSAGDQLTFSAYDTTLTDPEFRAFRKLIYEETGISLGEHKRQLLRSRLAKRLRHFGFASYGEYYDYLMQQDPDRAECRKMINCITTNKTDFFRESHHFDYLRDKVFPQLRERAARGGPCRLRIWSAACSTGEEPYSLAMTVREQFGPPPGWDVQILASDIDTDVLTKAEAGVYTEDRLQGISQEFKRKYFLRGTGSNAGLVAVRPEVRDLITFRHINLVDHSWPVETGFDVIFCRNVIIYFNRDTQRRLFERMSRSLAPNGYLFLGHSENLHWLTDLFVPLGNTVYRLHDGARVTGPARPNAATVASGIRESSIIVGGVFASREPAVVSTLLGSCVAACLYDPDAGVGGMNHFLVPASSGDEMASARHGVHAMELLINAIMRKGGDRRRLQAKVFGGARMHSVSSSTGDVGRKNGEFVKEFLAAERIPLVSHALGGTHARKIRFFTHTGKVLVKELEPRSEEALASREERLSKKFTRRLSNPPRGGVTLFTDQS
jgi:chemotaxis protein methyltransferase CheR